MYAVKFHVFKEMKNMRMPIYELYQGGGRPSAVAGPSSAIYASNIYDSLTPSSSSSMAAAAAALTNGGGIGDPSSAYGNLATLQPAQLQPTYVNLLTNTAAVAVSATDYYAATAAATNGSADYYSRMRPLQTMPLYAPVETTDELVESRILTLFRLSRSSQMASSGLFNNKPIAVDMPSPVDSGIGAELLITPKQEIHDNPGFMYTDMNSIAHVMQQQQQQMQQQQQQQQQLQKPKESHSPRTSSSDRIVTNRESPYTLEAPISTSARRDDDRLTYLNKGQFYTVTLEYIPDPVKPLKSVTVKSIMLLVFREEKSYEDEIKCWQFWHSRQHSAKQRILDVDAKNSTGVIGAIEEVAHNAIAFYWNPTEQIVKVNVGVQCLSTDFSNQKGVKGLPLHLQVDTFDEAYSKSVPFHRGYCQVKIFCDKINEIDFRICSKGCVFRNCNRCIDYFGMNEVYQSFYLAVLCLYLMPFAMQGANRKMLHEQRRDEKRRLNGRKKTDDEYHEPCERSPFYHMSNLSKPAVLFVPPEDYDRVNKMMIYVRKQDEEIFTPLHLVPPNLQGLANAISEKFNLKSSQITGLFRQNLKGYTIKMDDDMVQYYCNEDSFVIHFSLNNDDTECNNNSTFSVTLAELEVSRRSPSESPS
uniref:Grh/CP2 DB domain-containing protein n=1 Tax=Romanomermis culicivorax TaxID=13658 RepID=A0A915KYP7_ROMCU